MEKEKDGLGNPLVIAAATNVAVKVLPYAIGGGILFYFANKLLGNNRHESLKRDKYWFTDQLGIKYNALDLAVSYRAAMDGMGTYEATLMELAKKSRGSRFSKISKAFFKIARESLFSRLQEELNEEDLATFNAIRGNVPTTNLPSNQVNYEFGIGVNVGLKSYGTTYKYVTKVNGEWKVKTDRFANYGSAGKVLDRKRFKTNGTFDNYYKISDYPKLYILGVALKRIY